MSKNEKSRVKAVALFSGGLDSILAVKLIQEQNVDVAGLTFTTPFFSAYKALTAARYIGLNLHIMDITDEHLEMLKAPRYGYGRNLNPCIDCHTLMLKKAGEKMHEWGASFIFTGEVLGQRPMSQTRQSLHIVAKNSGYGPYILRPLSAKRLSATLPEELGNVDRDGLLNIQGRGRKRQLELAAHYGITDYGNPSGGCLLTDPAFSNRLRDLLHHTNMPLRKELELLKVGRHFRLSPKIKVIVGRNKRDNSEILNLAEDVDAVLNLQAYPGPTTLVPYGGRTDDLIAAASLCILYGDAPKDEEVAVLCRIGGSLQLLTTHSAKRDTATDWMI
jgi:hypothetical protein